MDGAGGSETQTFEAAKTMPTGPQDNGNPLFSPLLTFSRGGVSKLTINHSLFFSLFSPLIENWP